MRARIASLNGVAVLSVVLALAVSPAPAEDLRASGLEEVAAIAIPDTTHLEFMRRTIDGVERTFALVGSRNGSATVPVGTPQGGLNIVDVTDPEAPAFVLNVPCRTDNLDIATVPVAHTINDVAYDTFIVLASNDGVGCTWDGKPTGGLMLVGLRAQPEAGSLISADFLRSPFVKPDGSPWRTADWKSPAAHTVVRHPSRAILYSGNQMLADRTPTVEITNLEVWPPVIKQHRIFPVDRVGNASGPHDITFDPSGDRAYVSSITVSMIWDTSGDKALAPELVSVIDSPNLKIHHEANLHPDGRHLLVVDEFVATSGDNVGQCPGGGVHIFDLGKDRELERAPVHVGQFYANDLSFIPPEVDPAGPDVVRADISCTAHEFSMPSSGRWTPIAWFGAGVRLVDTSAIKAALTSQLPVPIVLTELGYHVPHRTDTWAAKVHPADENYIVTSDTSFGLRVLKVTATLP